MLLELRLVSHIAQVEVVVATVKVTEVLRLVIIQSELYAALHIETLFVWLQDPQSMQRGTFKSVLMCIVANN